MKRSKRSRPDRLGIFFHHPLSHRNNQDGTDLASSQELLTPSGPVRARATTAMPSSVRGLQLAEPDLQACQQGSGTARSEQGGVAGGEATRIQHDREGGQDLSRVMESLVNQELGGDVNQEVGLDMIRELESDMSQGGKGELRSGRREEAVEVEVGREGQLVEV